MRGLIAAIMLLFFLPALSQYGGDKSDVIPAAGGTFSFIQAGHCNPGSGTSCTLTGWTSAIAANDLITITGDGASLYQVTSLVNGTGTFTLGSQLNYAYGCSTGLSGQPPSPLGEYILPSGNAGGSGTTVTLNFGNFANGGSVVSGTTAYYVTEWRPSANPSLVGLAADVSQFQPTASTSGVGPTVTANGTNPVTATTVYGTTGFSNITAVSSPYSSQFYSNAAWLADATAATLTPATFTIASDKVMGCSMVFAFGSTAITQGTAMNQQGASNGTAWSDTNYMASMQGLQGYIPTDAGTDASSTYDTATTFPILSAFGPLNDGSTLAVGSYPSVKFTSTGANTNGKKADPTGTRTNQVDYYSAPYSLGIWFETDGSCAGSWNADNAALDGQNASATEFVNMTTSASGGNCNFKIEASNGSVQNVNFSTSTRYWEDFYFGGNSNATATFTNGSASIAATNTLVAGQWVNFDTTSALPTNFSTGSVYCVIATGLSTSHFEVAAACGGTAISAGSAGTGTQTVVFNPHSIKVYNIVNITGASCTSGTTTLTTAGLPADGNITTGTSIALENVNPSAWNGTFSSITVSGNNISYSQTCPGPAYSSGGTVVAQLGATMYGPAKIGPMYYSGFNFGAFETITTGIHFWHGALKLSLSGTDPLLP